MKAPFNLVIQFACIASLALTSNFSFGQRLFQSTLIKEEAKPVEMTEVELPKPFKKGDLTPFVPSESSSIKFFIDKESISFINHDEVRLTVVTLNESDKYQGIYIGFRCDEYEFRQYGFLDDGVWRRPAALDWRKIPKPGYNQYVAFLARYSTCQGGGAVLGKTKLLEGLTGVRKEFE